MCVLCFYYFFIILELIDIVLGKQYAKIKCRFLTTSCDYFNDILTIEVQNILGGVCREMFYIPICIYTYTWYIGLWHKMFLLSFWDQTRSGVRIPKGYIPHVCLDLTCNFCLVVCYFLSLSLILSQPRCFEEWNLHYF